MSSGIDTSLIRLSSVEPMNGFLRKYSPPRSLHQCLGKVPKKQKKKSLPDIQWRSDIKDRGLLLKESFIESSLDSHCGQRERDHLMGNNLSSLQRWRTEEAPESMMFILLFQDVFGGWMDEVHRLFSVPVTC